MKRTDIHIGMTFERWTVVGVPYLTGKNYVVPVRCSCGNTSNVQPAQLCLGKSRSCGCLRNEEARDKMWKGGRTVLGGGYIGIYQPDHPNAEKLGYVREHVLVISEHLGRPLIGDENIHHKNGVRDDNRLENLELWSVSQPKGQRVEDKVAWAKELLSFYEPEALLPAKERTALDSDEDE